MGGRDRWAVQCIPVLPLVSGFGGKSQKKQTMIKAAQRLCWVFSPGCFQGSLTDSLLPKGTLSSQKWMVWSE